MALFRENFALIPKPYKFKFQPSSNIDDSVPKRGIATPIAQFQNSKSVPSKLESCWNFGISSHRETLNRRLRGPARQQITGIKKGWAKKNPAPSGLGNVG